MRTLIWQSLTQRKTATIATMLTIAVSVAAFVALSALYGGTQRGVALAQERGGAQMLVVPREASSSLDDTELLFSGAPVPAYFSATEAERIAGIEGVEQVAVQFFGQTLTESCCTTGAELRVIGIDAGSAWLIEPFTSLPLAGGLEPGQLLIGAKVSGFESGSGLLLGTRLQVAGILEQSGTSLDNALLVNIDQLRSLVATTPQMSHLWDEYGQPQELVSAVLLSYAKDAEPRRIINKIEALGGLKVIEHSLTLAQTTRELGVLFAAMFVAGIVLALASLLQLAARFFTLVWERKAQLALYRALGATRGMLRLVIGGEALIIVSLGCVCGVAAGLGLSELLIGALQASAAFPFVALDAPVLLAFAGVILLLFYACAAASIVAPLAQVARLDPAAAMQQLDIG